MKMSPSFVASSAQYTACPKNRKRCNKKMNKEPHANTKKKKKNKAQTACPKKSISCTK